MSIHHPIHCQVKNLPKQCYVFNYYHMVDDVIYRSHILSYMCIPQQNGGLAFLGIEGKKFITISCAPLIVNDTEKSNKPQFKNYSFIQIIFSMKTCYTPLSLHLSIYPTIIIQYNRLSPNVRKKTVALLQKFDMRTWYYNLRVTCKKSYFLRRQALILLFLICKNNQHTDNPIDSTTSRSKKRAVSKPRRSAKI